MKFEDIIVGFETAILPCVFSDDDVRVFGNLSGDKNPLHYEKKYAESKGFDKPLVHGILLASKFSFLVGMVIPGENSLYISQELRFHKPIFVGEKISFKGTVISKSESTKIVEIKTEIFNSGGDLAVSGKALVKII
ncbi:hypothetical protein A2W48_00425 [Candidatus Giovannonibacteria bacterium RIFCSPHIGHO2_12_44_12]|uniref:MaoC-like domain-containing protein n=4 Tax=Candidatus Giovannoniibacteriota TaxID=1752738 RepID=A0A1F5X2N0_9BACT|nr:MAG: MaoC domain protein dehydratase [Candidatus Giovannonibacteria bacterium GW2011_GWA2_44_26]OGF73747.1 MAG: hypothetical protein A2W57_03140 [Candidatus Giovannonibacteria bacterium RIFCSPHIGHO2_02_43_16]OGF81821.1 MAG: hypothetical protein A2W48_00425 [Candidatus Giovannonibacteria bacterium RIFCSPHIGHO2_12_44_12]OGF85451.1 MAG: hypothetical protein A2Z63_01700 [Candidatus Giovannonibacteria bacterium RIFCSPLOWO2_02_44_8]